MDLHNVTPESIGYVPLLLLQLPTFTISVAKVIALLQISYYLYYTNIVDAKFLCFVIPCPKWQKLLV